MYSCLRKIWSKKSVGFLKTVVRTNSSSEVEKAEDVVYPQILDLSHKAKVRRLQEAWHDKIKKLESVEEKIYGLNMPHYYGWKSLLLREGEVSYNSLDHAQYITRTHVINGSKLPEIYESVITNEELNTIANALKPHIENILVFEYCSRLRDYEITEKIEKDRKNKLQNVITNAIIFQINRLIMSIMSPTVPHLLEAEVDFEPRIEAFWFVGGIERQAGSIKAREKLPHLKDHANDPINIPVQYYGSPILQLRHHYPLREFVPLSDSTNTELNVPIFTFDPRTIGYKASHKHATCIPGFWPGDPAEYGLLSYHSLNSLYSSSVPVDEETIAVQAIFASYGWLLSQAHYQGFTSVNDITYPLATQTILTTGQQWLFCTYQLNTTILYTDYASNNVKRNICWITEPMQLFEKVEDDKVHGFNEDVLKKLILFYVNKPVERTDVNMKPYLGESVKHIADISDVERRTWLEQHYKHLVSNRPRHFEIPQIHNWQKIYLIDNQTRPLDKKRDPWQFGYRPSRRRLNDHLPIYIPRCLREKPNKRKVGRWAKTYYPDA